MKGHHALTRTLLLLLSILLGMLPCSGQEALDLETWLTREDLWQTTSKQLPSAAFQWLTNEKQSARLSPEENVTLAEMPVGEVVLRFANGQLSDIGLDLYARGDADGSELDRAAFTKLVEEARAWLTKHTGQQPKELKTSSGIGKAQRQVWLGKRSAFQLSHGFQRARKSRDEPFVAEFIRIRVKPNQRSAPAKRGAAWLKQQVRREPSGEVWIAGVPMIDQGDKGYCVVASAERVLRHYGMDVSQHELAQLAASHRKRGTSIAAMTDALRGASRVLQVRVREHYSLFGNRSLKQLVDRYNRLARREKAPVLGYDADFFSKAKPDLILKSRVKLAAYGRFETDIQRAIDQGIPLL